MLARPVPRNPGGIIFRKLPYSPPKGATQQDSDDWSFAVEFDVELRNTGQSPAINANAIAPYSTFTPKRFFTWNEIKKDFSAEDYPKTTEGFVIPANSSIIAKVGQTGFPSEVIDGKSMAFLWGGGSVFYVLGKIR